MYFMASLKLCIAYFVFVAVLLLAVVSLSPMNQDIFGDLLNK